ncbi:APC family permease [Pseudomonas japonica]|uniref:Amino acid/polyamine/organocation transporter, APC superfamily n=1 Tax=Pseudomonas japonica TaxID=256466 RepID=A0A239F0W9_9PSED|nr:APC family permease [Pseudomonas japonica]SNS50539.1 amino acid/polyamine/organocation transporter, APC superfamily [Pseudomonas japonica]
MGLAHGTPGTQEAAGLRRTLGMKDLIAYGLAYIAPMAPLTTFGFVWDASGGLIALAYLLGAICMYFTAQSYATMSATVPCSGSVYGFARHSLGQLPGFIAGWLILLDYLLIPALVFLVMAVGLQTLLPNLDRATSLAGLVVISLAVNWLGVAVTTRVSLVSVVVQFLAMFALVALALQALADGKGAGALTAAPFYAADQFDLMKLFTATSICVLSFLGFDAISTLSEEVRSDDRRMIGRAIFSVLAICTLLFVGSTWVLGNLMPGVRISDASSTIYQLLAVQISPFSALAVAWLIALLAGFTNVLPMQVGVSRVLFAMGRDRQLPSVLARLHGGSGTPHVALLFSTLVSLAVAVAMRDHIDTLASFVNFGALSAFALLHVSVLVEFAVKQRSPRVFAHWIVPVVGIAVVLVVLHGMERTALEIGGAWLLIGCVYGLFLRRKGRIALKI